MLTVQEIMCHPWVTDEGRAPLRSCADLGLGSIEVTTQEQLGAIDRASVVSMIRARLKEKVFRSNEYLFQAVSGSSSGQPVSTLLASAAAAVQSRTQLHLVCAIHAGKAAGAHACTAQHRPDVDTCVHACCHLSVVHLLCCAQGQPMNCVYFVMSGAVEILRSATQEDVEREFSGNTSIEHSFTVDIDESLMLDCSVVGDGMMPIGAVNGRLHIDRLKVCR
jgi:hypothetical protein